MVHGTQLSTLQTGAASGQAVLSGERHGTHWPSLPCALSVSQKRSLPGALPKRPAHNASPPLLSQVAWHAPVPMLHFGADAGQSPSLVHAAAAATLDANSTATTAIARSIVRVPPVDDNGTGGVA